jgi:hypothetical protein
VRFDRKRKGKTLLNADWKSPTDPDARIAKMKDGTTQRELWGNGRHLRQRLDHEASQRWSMRRRCVLAVKRRAQDKSQVCEAPAKQARALGASLTLAPSSRRNSRQNRAALSTRCSSPETVCMTRSFPGHDQPHIRSSYERLHRDPACGWWARMDETILQIDVSGQARCRFVLLDSRRLYPRPMIARVGMGDRSGGQPGSDSSAEGESQAGLRRAKRARL